MAAMKGGGSNLRRAIPAGQELRLVAAMAALLVAGTVQELLLLVHRPALGILLVLPAVALAAALWRPSREAAVAAGIAFGLELLLPLMTGGGMVVDWVRHYEISLHYAGLPSAILHSYLASRTVLSEQILGAVLNHVPQYWAFQLGSVALNSLWLWPASLLLQAAAPARVDGRLLAVAAAPFVLYYSIYTWPWAFALFFLLAATWLAGREGRPAGVGIGLGAAGALLVHPAMLGYVLGLSGWVILRRRQVLLPALATGSIALVAQLPWVYDITSGAGPLALITHSDPGQAHVPPLVYLLTRPLLVLHTIIPFPPLVRGLEVPDFAFSLLVHSLPGALAGLLLLTRAQRRLRGPEPAIIASGAAVSLLIYPSESMFVGIIDALYPAVVIAAIGITSRLPQRPLRRVLIVNLALGALGAALMLWIAVGSHAPERNVALRQLYAARFLVEVLTPLAGLAVLAATAWVAAPLVRPAAREAPRI